MPEAVFDQLAELSSHEDRAQLFERLIEELRSRGDYHHLFDARMLQKKAELGLPLSRPSSLQDVPEDQRKEVEATYIEAARETGNAFLEQGDIPSAWMYFQVIRDPAPVATAIEALPTAIDDYDRVDALVQVALFQGVCPQKGVELMLHAHGTCSTITALDQAMGQLEQDQRAACASIMVKSLYTDVCDSVRRHVETRGQMLPPNEPLRTLILGRDWLFEGGNYHVDVSHLNAVVRFARSIETPEELDLALQLAEYGSHLDSQLQYGGDPPFNDFYPAHVQFFNVLLGKETEDGLQYFRSQLEAEPDEQDRPLLAYVLVDLLMRCGKLDEAVDVASKYLANLGDDVSISFDELCIKANRLDVLREVRKSQDDLVGYTAALLRSGNGAASA